MNYARLLASIACLLTISNCTSFRELETSASANDSEAIFILGVSPDNYRVQIFPGKINGDVYSQNVLSLAAFLGTPKDGYIVGKAHVGDVLAITAVTKVDKPSDFRGRSFFACPPARTMTFTIPNKRSIYLGDVSYQMDGSTLRVAYSENLDSAIRYMREHYPNAELPEKIPYSLLPTTMHCNVEIIVPIYVH